MEQNDIFEVTIMLVFAIIFVVLMILTWIYLR